MGLPVFRFTLSHTPIASVSSSITLPSNTEGENVGSGDQEWTLGSVPSVNLPGEGLITPTQTSEIFAIDLRFAAGLEYTVNYSISYNIGTNTSDRYVQFVILGSADNILYSEDKAVSAGAGSLTDSSTFTAPADAVKFGFWVRITNTLPNVGGSTFQILNSYSGSVTTIAEPGSPSSITITEPMGWKDSKLKLERHPDFHSLVEYFETGLTYYGANGIDDGGINFLKSKEQEYGYKAKIIETIEADIDGDGVFEEQVFTGLKDLVGLQEIPDNKMEVPTIRNDLWARFIERLDVPVDLRSSTSLDGDIVTPVEPVTINLPCQPVRKRYAGTVYDTPNYVGIIANGEYFQIDFDRETLKEFKEKSSLLRTDNSVIPVPLFEMKEAGSYQFDLQLDCGENIVGNNMQASAARYSIFIKFDNEEVQLSETTVSMGTGDSFTRYTFNGTRVLSLNSVVRIYGKRIDTGGGLFCMFGTNPESYVPLGYIEPSTIDANFYNLINPHLTVTADTTYPDSEAEGFFLHDAFAGVIERIVGRNAFYSEILGRTDTNMRQYAANGCYSKNVLLKGLQIRSYSLTEKPFSASFNDLWKGANPIFNLGLGYETIDGTEYIRLEDKAYFYDNDVSIDVSNVRQITREYDPNVIYNKIDVGYTKWQSEEVSSIDDPQTKREYSIK